MRVINVVFVSTFTLWAGVVAGSRLEEYTTKSRMRSLMENSKQEHIESGYIKAYTDHLGQDVGVPFAKCKLSGGEPIVNGSRVACLKEMKND